MAFDPTKLGFTTKSSDSVSASQEVVCYHGPPNMGKTWQAIDRPGPIYFMYFDYNTLPTLKVYRKKTGREDIYDHFYKFRLAGPWKRKEPVLKKFEEDLQVILTEAEEGTIVIDSASMLFEIKRAVFKGKRGNAFQQWDLAKVEDWFIDMINRVKDTNLNIVFTVHEDRTYGGKRSWNGKWEPKPPQLWKKFPANLHTRLHLMIDTDRNEHTLTVVADKWYPEAVGLSIPYPTEGWTQIVRLREELDDYEDAERLELHDVFQLPTRDDWEDDEAEEEVEPPKKPKKRGRSI